MSNFYKSKILFQRIGFQYLLLPLLIIVSCNVSFAQCPPNLDFEEGTFNGWVCYTGNVTTSGTTNVISLSPSGGPITNRHTMLTRGPVAQLDPYGGFSQICPNGSNHCIKLGNNSGGAQAEGVSYTFTIPPGQDQFSLIYHYAVVFQDPGHQTYQQPRMEIDIENLTDGTSVGCSSFAFIASAGLPGFFLSPNPGGATPVWCKDWSANSINLDGNAGKTIQIFFKTADCTFNAHFGYAYIDLNTECSSSFVGATFCADDTAINVSAPFGYQNYKWFNSNFTQILGTTQVLHLSPPPLSGSIIKVELIPYNGYGCKDTLTANLWDTLTIHPYAGRDTSFCNSSISTVQLGAPPLLGLVYHWNPPTGLNDPDIANPTATVTASTQYVLTVMHDGGGCLTRDTVNINVVNYDTTLQVIGPANYCSASGQSVALKVHSGADSIQWYFNGGPIAGANQVQYNITQTGAYYATLFSFAGCSFNTRIQQINIYQSPVAGFNVNNLNECYDGNVFVFINSSSPPSGTPQYLWTFGDGTSATAADVTHSYPQPGTYIVKMRISGNGSCADSSSVTLHVFPSTKAGFKVNKVAQCYKNNQFIFTDTSTFTVGATISYNWDLGDGNTTNSKDVTHVYALPGTYTVTLHTDAGGGCTDQVSYDMTVYPSPVAGFTHNSLTQCNKGNQFIFTNSSTITSGAVQYNWDLGDGILSTAQDVTYSYAKAGGYTVKLLVSTTDGCADSSKANVTVYPNPTADFTVQPICINLPVPVINKTINNTTSTLNYLWDFGNGQVSTQQSPVYSYPVPGNYIIKLAVNSVQCPSPSDTMQHTIAVDAPAPGITYPVKDAVILFPEPLKARNIGSNVSWNPAFFLDNRNSYTPFFKGKDPQLYLVTLKTLSGCITVDTQYVKTHKKIEIYVPTAFTPGTTLNNYLRPTLMGFDKVNYFRIYDRWGKLLFEMKSDRPGWDGKTGNVLQELQTVIWMIEAVDVDGVTHHRQGSTILLR